MFGWCLVPGTGISSACVSSAPPEDRTGGKIGRFSAAGHAQNTLYFGPRMLSCTSDFDRKKRCKKVIRITFCPAGMPAGSLANSSRTAYNRAVLSKSLIRLFLLALQRHRARVRLHTWRALFLPGITSAAWLALLLPGTSAPSSVYVKVCKDFRKWGCFRRLGAALSHGACPVIRWFCGDSIRDMKAGFHHLLPRSE